MVTKKIELNDNFQIELSTPHPFEGYSIEVDYKDLVNKSKIRLASLVDGKWLYSTQSSLIKLLSLSKQYPQIKEEINNLSFNFTKKLSFFDKIKHNIDSNIILN